jgi:pimeloyl-ACP methyl ester carboxylesterase
VESVVAHLQDPIGPAFARAFVADTSSGQLAPGLVDEMAGEVMKVPVSVWKQVFGGLLAYDDLVELPRMTVPTLLVWGDADRLVDREMQQTLAECLPRVELVVYHGIGHTPRWEDPARFARDVASFTRQVQPRPT